MLKCVRGWFVLATSIAIVITLSDVVVIAISSQGTAVSTSKQENVTSTKSKKRKKRRKPNATAPLLLTSPIATQPSAKTAETSSSVTAALNDAVESGSASIPQTTRGINRAARLPRAHISPIAPSGVVPPGLVFSNPAPISMTSSAPNQPATPYPSNITVSGLTQKIASLTLTLTDFSHEFPADVQMLLVAPNGAEYRFWSAVGGNAPVTNLNITIDDAAATQLPNGLGLATGSFRPAVYDPTLVFPSPAPTPPYNNAAPVGASTLTSVFGGLTPAQANGTWSLYIVDTASTDVGSISGGWSLNITEATPPPAAGQLIISEFRLRGFASAQDEFIELYNTTASAITVSSLSGTGFGVAASDGVTRCTVPNGTVIPAAGHYLCVNTVGYSLAAYPAGNGTTATGDATYTTDIPDNAGIALFNNNTGGASYSLANRLDAVGSTSEANTVYKEGTGYPPLTTLSGSNYAFYRDTCGKGGSITTLGACTRSTPKDTDNNAADFIYVEPNGISGGPDQRLGGPGPENLSSPIQHNVTIPATLLDPCVAGASAPNRVRDFTAVPDGPQGTLDIRRTFTNNTGASVIRLRYRIIDITTFPAPAGVAFLRAVTSTDVVVTVDRAPCGSGTSNVTVTGTTLEEAAPPGNQAFGGGFNSSLSSGSITLGTPLANGASIDIRLLFGIQQTGVFKVYVNVEALP